MRIVYGARDTNVCMYVCVYAQGYLRLRLVLGRHPKVNLFGLRCYVICCEVETEYSLLTVKVSKKEIY